MHLRDAPRSALFRGHSAVSYLQEDEEGLQGIRGSPKRPRAPPAPRSRTVEPRRHRPKLHLGGAPARPRLRSPAPARQLPPMDQTLRSLNSPEESGARTNTTPATRTGGGRRWRGRGGPERGPPLERAPRFCRCRRKTENETSLRIASASPPDRYLSPKLENNAQY